MAGDRHLLLYTPDLTAADTIDLASALLPGEAITHVVADPSGSGLHVVAASDRAGAIITVRRRDGRALARVGLGGVPTAAAMHPDGHSLMVATRPGTAETQQRSTLHFVPLDGARTAAEAELCGQPARAMVPFRDLDRLYVACDGGELAEIDLRLRTQIRIVQFAEPQDHMGKPCGPVGAGLSSNATLIYVLCRETGTLLYLDRARLTLFDSLVVGSGASSLATTPNRRRAVVTRPQADEVAILDLRGRSVADRAAFGAPSSSSVSSDGRWAYVVGAEGVLRVDLEEMQMLAKRGLHTGATAVAVWPGHSSPIMRWQPPESPPPQSPQPRRGQRLRGRAAPHHEPGVGSTGTESVRMDADHGAARREGDTVSGRAAARQHHRVAAVFQHRAERVGVELHPHAGAADHGLEPGPSVERRQLDRGPPHRGTVGPGNRARHGDGRDDPDDGENRHEFGQRHPCSHTVIDITVSTGTAVPNYSRRGVRLPIS